MSTFVNHPSAIRFNNISYEYNIRGGSRNFEKGAPEYLTPSVVTQTQVSMNAFNTSCLHLQQKL